MYYYTYMLRCKDNTISIMVNGGDHIIINCVLGGCSFKEEFSEVNRIDDIIEKFATTLNEENY